MPLENGIKKKNPVVRIVTNVWVIVSSIGTVAAVIGAIWMIDDRYVNEPELESLEARIISEMRSEAAETRSALIEDMESRLDEYDFDISIMETEGQVIPEALRIKRNMLDRRIQGLKNNEIDSNSN